MDVSMLQLPPGDPGLIDKIVCQLKSNGIFDQFRKECIADVDTKPAYQNLRQRVEGSVSSFLSNQEWRPDLNKNQLRDSLRKHIHESGFLEIGVERIVDQVVNPKMYTVFFPKVEDVVYGFLGLEKPRKGTDAANSVHFGIPKVVDLKPEKKFISLKDLLPTDLDPISPEKLDSDEEDIDEISAQDEVEDFQSTKEVSAPKEEPEENGVNEEEKGEVDEEEEDEEEASPPFESLEVDTQEPHNPPPVPLHQHSADMLDNITSSSSSSETKDVLQFGEMRRQECKEEEEVAVGAVEEEGQQSSLEVATEKAWGEGEGEEPCGEGAGEGEEEGGEGQKGEGGEEEMGVRKGEEGEEKVEVRKEGKKPVAREEGSSRNHERRPEGSGSGSTANRSREKGSRGGEERKRSSRRDEHHHSHHHHHGSSRSSSKREVEKRREGGSSSKEDWKKERGGHSAPKEKGTAGGGSGSRRSGGSSGSGEKTSSSSHHGGGQQQHHRHRSSGGHGHHHSDKDRKVEGGSGGGGGGGSREKKGTDDHRYERDKKGRDGHRRWDRDRERSREGRGGEGGSKQSTAAGASSSSSGGKGSSGGSKGGSGCGKGGSSGAGGSGGTSECEENKRVALLEEPLPMEMAKHQPEVVTPSCSSDAVPKVKKPKIAANIYEVKKIIQARKRLEREMFGKGEESVKEVVAAAPPIPDQEDEGRWEGGRGKGPEGEGDAEWGEVLYLEDAAKQTDFVSYVKCLSREAEAGDFSRVPLMGAADLDDDEGGPLDFVELSDVDLSREEEEVLTRLGALVERKGRGICERSADAPASAKCQAGEEGGGGKRPRRPNPRYNSGEYSTYSDEEGGLLGVAEGSEGEEEEEDEPQQQSSSVVENIPLVNRVDGGEGLSVGQRRRRGAVVGRRLGVRGPLRRVATPDAFVMPLSPESDVSTASGDAGRKALLINKEGHDAELVPEEFESESRRGSLPPPHLLTTAVVDGYQHPATECDGVQAEGIVIGGVTGHPSCRMEEGEQRRHDESPVSLGTRRMRGTRSSSRVQQRYNSDDLYKPRPNITLGRRNRGKNSPSQEDTLEGGGEEEGERSPVRGDAILMAGPTEGATPAADCLPNKKRRR